MRTPYIEWTMPLHTFKDSPSPLHQLPEALAAVRADVKAELNRIAETGGFGEIDGIDGMSINVVLRTVDDGNVFFISINASRPVGEMLLREMTLRLQQAQQRRRAYIQRIGA